MKFIVNFVTTNTQQSKLIPSQHIFQASPKFQVPKMEQLSALLFFFSDCFEGVALGHQVGSLYFAYINWLLSKF